MQMPDEVFLDAFGWEFFIGRDPVARSRKDSLFD